MNDNELIYLIRNENLNNARDELNKKYIRYMINYQNRIIHSKVNGTFDVETNNITSNSYFALQESLEKFNLKQNKFSFGQLISNKCKQNLFNDFRKDLKHVKTNNWNRENKESNTIETQLQDTDSKHFQYGIINDFLQREPSITKKVIKFRLLGFKNSEIARKLRISKKKIENRFSYFLKIFKNSNCNRKMLY